MASISPPAQFIEQHIRGHRINHCTKPTKSFFTVA